MRVPVSIVVRTNSASNMIAKWYQYASSVFMPGSPQKTRDMPTASDTAPPVRAAMTSSAVAREAGQLGHLDAEAHEVAVVELGRVSAPPVDVVAERRQRAVRQVQARR